MSHETQKQVLIKIFVNCHAKRRFSWYQLNQAFFWYDISYIELQLVVFMGYNL